MPLDLVERPGHRLLAWACALALVVALVGLMLFLQSGMEITLGGWSAQYVRESLGLSEKRSILVLSLFLWKIAHLADWGSYALVFGAYLPVALGIYLAGLRWPRFAQGAGAASILAATFLGYPISSTHVISGGVMGAGAVKRLSAVRWGVAGNILIAWLLTLPASAAVGAAAYGIARLLGLGA